jgi:hypothetical protein
MALASHELIGENGMTRATCLPHLLNLALFDLYVISHIERLMRSLFEMADRLSSAIEAILSSIEESGLHMGFVWWMKRLHQCNATNGDAIEPAQALSGTSPNHAHLDIFNVKVIQLLKFLSAPSK